MVASLIYALARVLLDAIALRRSGPAELEAEVLALRRQVQVLERQIKRVRWTPADRMIMAALRDRLSPMAWAGLLVRPETVLGWHRALVRRKWASYHARPRRSRPRIPAECRHLIIRMAMENPSWGYPRIRGELLKLGHTVAATTIRSVLLAARISPSPRRAPLSWKQFLVAHAETLVAADFLSVETVFFKRLYVLVSIHLASRRILLASCTDAPTESWVTQQTRNLAWRLEELEINLKVAIHDRDRKFARRADEVLKSLGARVIVTPLLAPRANAYCERWIGSCRRECLDWMLVLNERHLRAILDAYVAHYNTARPHRSLDLRPPATRGDPIPLGVGEVRRRTRLGGLLCEYYREAAAA